MTLLKIVKSGETKNFISFDELTSGTNVYLTKTKFNKVLKLFKYWRSNQTSTSFTAQLFSLICHADDLNKIRFLKGFPEEMTIWLLWYTHKGGEEGFFKEYGNITEGTEGSKQWQQD